MHHSFLPRARLLLALVCTLAMTSCSYQEKIQLPPAYDVMVCQGGGEFTFSLWHISADQREMGRLLQVSRHITPESLSSESTEIMTTAAADGITQRLYSDTRSQLIGSVTGSATAGESLPVALSNASGSFSATLTAGPETRRLASRVVKFSLSARLPYADIDAIVDESHESGRVMLRDGDTVVAVHPVRDGWLVWLIGARFSA